MGADPVLAPLETLTPPVLVSLAVLGLYLLAVVRLRLVGHRRWPWRRTGWAVLAGLTVAVAVSPLLPAGTSGDGHGPGHSQGVDGTATGLPDGAVAHMVQHLLLGMYAPLLVVLAAPVSLTLAVAPLRWRSPVRAVLGSRAVAVLTHPVVAAVPAVVGMHLLFLTPLYRLSLDDPWVHHLVQLHLLLAGCLLVLALVGGDPVPPRSGLLLRLGVLVVSAGTHAHLATLVYARAPQLPPGTPYDLVQTQQAALWMYYGGDVAEVLLAVLVCVGWYRGRRRGRPSDPPFPTGHASTRSAGVGTSLASPARVSGEPEVYRWTTPHAIRSLALPVRSVRSRAARPTTSSGSNRSVTKVAVDRPPSCR